MSIDGECIPLVKLPHISPYDFIHQGPNVITPGDNDDNGFCRKAANVIHIAEATLSIS